MAADWYVPRPEYQALAGCHAPARQIGIANFRQTHRTIANAWQASLLAALALCATGCRMVSQGRNVDGVRYFQQGQYPVALQRFDAALTIDPQNADTYYNKAAVYHRMGLANRDQNVLAQAESL